jgi:hypothetical protein
MNLNEIKGVVNIIITGGFVKRITTICILLFLPLTLIGTTAFAYQQVSLGNSQSGTTLLSQDQAGLTMQVDVGDLSFIDIITKAGQFVQLTADGLAGSQRIGEPNLPMLNRLISIPYGCELKTEVIESETQDISLGDLKITNPIMPVQPSLAKNQDPKAVPFEYNKGLYAQNGYYSMPLSDAKIVGIMRAVRMGMVSVAPFEYNPKENTLRVYKHLTIKVTFVNPDWATTRDMWRRYYSPFFTPVYQQLLNYNGQQSMLLDDLTQYPVKYLIVSARMFEAQLQPFIQWKIKKGFKVIAAYTDSIGTTHAAIKNYIHAIYNQGTPDDPAPSFVLLVGDAQQIPPYQYSGHISDLDFFEYTGDNEPEMYYGRFSAQNTGLLQPQIDKTLEYEQYLMPDPSYLHEVTMIAGVDAGMAPTYGNGQINYGTINYFNSSHGIHSNTWLYPQSNGNVEQAIIATINNGVSYINYTAHGGHDSWSDPYLSVSDVNALTNAHKYCLAVGNCCLTNTFGTDYGTPCLGEAWLQNANKGAIGYIGASDYSYWDEDYWWGVGWKAVDSFPQYNVSHRGAYDGMFHTHGEPVSTHYVTNDAAIFAGNLAVTQSGSGQVAYYWQVYHLMGDPSVSTYFGVPSANNIIHAPTILISANSFTVQADPGSYVGISMNGILHGAAYIDSSGTVDVPLTAFPNPGTADIVVTCQNRIPSIATVQVIAPSGPYVIFDTLSINDSNGNNDGRVDCGENIVLGVRLVNIGPDSANNVVATLADADTFVTISDSTESYGPIPGNNGTVNRPSAFAFQVSGRTPDAHSINFQLSVSGVALDTWISNFSILVHAPILNFVSVIINDNSGNGNGILDPGETAQMIVTIRNAGSTAANSVTGILSENDPYVSISDANGAFGNIAPGDSSSNSIDVFVVTASSSCPMGHEMAFGLTLGASSGYAGNISVPLMVGDRETVYSDDFSSNLGWTGLGGSGEWTIGQATGGAGNDGYGGPDPAVDHSPTDDNRVLGNDLTSGTGGDYSASLSQTYWVTSPVINCSNFNGTILSYWRWLGVEQNSYDHAYFAAKNRSGTWVNLFSNGGNTIDESVWSQDTYDISTYADSNANFQIRFGLGVTDGSWQYCGWNIDDILIKGYHQSPPGSPHLSFSIVNIADTVAQGDSCDATFKIYNGGDGVLNVQFNSTDSCLHFDHIQHQLAAHDSLNFTLCMNAIGLVPGMHNYNLNYTSNDPNNLWGAIPVGLLVVLPGCVYTPGDINGNHSVNGVDVVYAVNYFKGSGPVPPVDCHPNCPNVSNPFYAAGDVNGNCAFNGIDITYFVRYMEGQLPALLNCPDCPPPPTELPAILPVLSPSMKIKPIEAGSQQ